MRERVHGPDSTAIAPDAIVAFVTVRNEIERLPFFLRYYRDLGVDTFVFIDNASDDGTTDFLRAQDDAIIIWTDESYSTSRAGVLWLNAALDEYGTGRWCLSVDCDELFVFHGVEIVDLKILCRYLDSKKHEAVFTFMLDCYGAHKQTDKVYAPGDPFLKACPYFDGDGYYTSVNERFPFYSVFGGMRRRVFFENGSAGWGPALRKLPLIKWHPGMAYVFSTHASTPCRLSDLTGVLLHFKFLGDFGALAAAEVKRGDRFIAADYARYADTLATYKESFLYQDSTPFIDSSQLVRCGFVRTTHDWLNKVDEIVGSVEDKATALRLTSPLRGSLTHTRLRHAKPLHDTLHFIDLVAAAREEPNL